MVDREHRRRSRRGLRSPRRVRGRGAAVRGPRPVAARPVRHSHHDDRRQRLGLARSRGGHRRRGAYFLATLPNDGAEALLSHLMVGAHARLAEDGRRAVAQMGPSAAGQRRRADPDGPGDRSRASPHSLARAVHARAARRHAREPHGRHGEGRRLACGPASASPVRRSCRRRSASAAAAATIGACRRASLVRAARPIPRCSSSPITPTSAYEIVNFIDGKRTVSDIRDAVMAEFGQVPLPAVVAYLESLAKAGAIAIK